MTERTFAVTEEGTFKPFNLTISYTPVTVQFIVEATDFSENYETPQFSITALKQKNKIFRQFDSINMVADVFINKIRTKQFVLNQGSLAIEFRNEYDIPEYITFELRPMGGGMPPMIPPPLVPMAPIPPPMPGMATMSSSTHSYSQTTSGIQTGMGSYSKSSSSYSTALQPMPAPIPPPIPPPIIPMAPYGGNEMRSVKVTHSESKVITSSGGMSSCYKKTTSMTSSTSNAGYIPPPPPRVPVLPPPPPEPVYVPPPPPPPPKVMLPPPPPPPKPKPYIPPPPPEPIIPYRPPPDDDDFYLYENSPWINEVPLVGTYVPPSLRSGPLFERIEYCLHLKKNLKKTCEDIYNRLLDIKRRMEGFIDRAFANTPTTDEKKRAMNLIVEFLLLRQGFKDMDNYSHMFKAEVRKNNIQFTPAEKVRFDDSMLIFEKNFPFALAPLHQKIDDLFVKMQLGFFQDKNLRFYRQDQISGVLNLKAKLFNKL